MRKIPFFILSVLAISFWASCHKDPIITASSAKLNFSEDSVLFDTVFTTLGSTTKQFKIYNRNSKSIIISSIKLGLGNNSMFRLNVNGVPGKSFTNIELSGKDSIFIFVEVTVDPNNVNTPFIVTDFVVFETNGNIQNVNLVAFGQNAHYIRPNNFPKNGLPNYYVLGCNTTWNDSLPYVVYGFAVVDSLCNLTITKGTKIYFYKNSGLWVFKGGTLKVNGTKDAPVTFQGVRLEQEYKDLPGQWDRIWINEGSATATGNVIDYAVIKNGFIGIQAETLDPTNALGNNLKITNTIIKNMAGMGILSRIYNINGYNNVISNCGQYALAITGGGNYEFDYCTFANYWSLSQRKTPSVFLSNYFIRGNINYLNNLDSAKFVNCIIYGNTANEIGTDFNSAVASNYKFDHSLIKIDPATPTPTSNYIGVIKNKDPGFKNLITYELGSSSPAINSGDPSINLPLDLKGNSRDSAPDMGAFEFK